METGAAACGSKYGPLSASPVESMSLVLVAYVLAVTGILGDFVSGHRLDVKRSVLAVSKVRLISRTFLDT